MTYSTEGATPLKPISWLRGFKLFREPDPAWEIDMADEELCGGAGRLWYNNPDGGSVQEMVEQADRTCYQYTGQRPPSQVGLFLSQFPDRDYHDATYALAQLHAHREIGPGCCAAAIWIEPLEYPEDIGAQIQRWATYHLTKHAWANARSYAERVLRSRKVRWVSPEAREMIEAYLRRNHDRAEEFLQQEQLHHDPLSVPGPRA